VGAVVLPCFCSSFLAAYFFFNTSLLLPKVCPQKKLQ